jgi:hypothetical protein
MEMRKRALGNNLEVPASGLGCMRMAMKIANMIPKGDIGSVIQQSDRRWPWPSPSE